MQRWSFPGFRSHNTSNTTNSRRYCLHEIRPEVRASAATSSSSSSASKQPQGYQPSDKFKKMEQTLRSRISKQKAKNEQTRKNIASLEAKSGYLRRLKQLEEEVSQLEQEGTELARREDEVKRIVDRETAGSDNLRNGEQREGAATIAVAVEEEEEQVGAEIEEDEQIKDENGVEEEQNRGRLRIKREAEDHQQGAVDQIVQKGQQQDNSNGVKQEVEVKVKSEQIEEIELLNGAAAWAGV